MGLISMSLSQIYGLLRNIIFCIIMTQMVFDTFTNIEKSYYFTETVIIFFKCFNLIPVYSSLV